MFEKTVWDDEETWYEVSVVDSYYDNESMGLLNRLKRAGRALFGKPTYYNNVFLDRPEKFESLMAQLQELKEWQPPITKGEN